MIEVKEAYNIARKVVQSYDLLGCTDAGDVWLFHFGKLGENGMFMPGAPNVSVRKSDGEVVFVTIPPVSNLALWSKGIKVDISEVL